MSSSEDLRREAERLLEKLAQDQTVEQPGIRQILLNQTRKRLRNVQSHLAPTDKRISFRFIDTEEPERHSLRTLFLGSTLQELQHSLNYLVWSSEAGPAVHGDVPTSILRSAATEVVSVDHGSFVVLIRKTELELSDSFDRSVDRIFDLVDAADESALGEDVRQIVAGIGTEASIRLERLFRRIGREEVSVDLQWQGSESRQSFLSAIQASALADWLHEGVSEEQLVRVRGVLKMADYDASRFKLLDPATGAVYEGRSNVDLAHVEITAEYDTSIMIVTVTSPVTGERRERMTLYELTRVI